MQRSIRSLLKKKIKLAFILPTPTITKIISKTIFNLDVLIGRLQHDLLAFAAAVSVVFVRVVVVLALAVPAAAL